MSKTELKNKIATSVEQLDSDGLKSTYLIIKELIAQQKHTIPKEYKNAIDNKIAIGIRQIENNESKDFGIFLNELDAKYGKKQ